MCSLKRTVRAILSRDTAPMSGSEVEPRHTARGTVGCPGGCLQAVGAAAVAAALCVCVCVCVRACVYVCVCVRAQARQGACPFMAI